MPNSLSTKVLVESALLAGITAIIALAGMFIPLFNFLTLLVTAVPIIIAVVRNDFYAGFLASLIAAFLIFVLAGPIQSILFYIQFMLMALAYGYMFKKQISIGKILVIGTTITVISTLLILGLMMFVSNIDWQQQKEMLLNTVDETLQLYEKYGVLQQLEEQGISQAELKKNLLASLRIFLRVIPAMLILASILSSIVNFVVAKFFLRRIGFQVEKFPPFTEWRLPWYTIWGLIIGWGSFLLGDYLQQDFFVIVGQNILIAYSIILFVLGLSVISFFFKKRKISILGRLFFILLVILMLQPMVLITVFLGMFDLVLDYRKLNKPKAT